MSMTIVGYPDRLSVAAGETLTFFVSSSRPTYRASLVRLVHGDRNPAGPGFIVEPRPSNLDGEHSGGIQTIRPGSCAIVRATPRLDDLKTFSVALWAWPADARTGLQTLAARGSADAGWRLELEGARLQFRVGGATVRLEDLCVPAKTWCFVCASYDAALGELSISASVSVWPHAFVHATAQTRGAAGLAQSAALILAACEESADRYAAHFNGKIEDPTILDRVLAADEVAALRGARDRAGLPGLVCAWDFGPRQDSDVIVDVGGGGCDGRLRNMPARAMIGRRWTGDEHDFRAAPDQYSAIHFHDDDLSDAEWNPSLELEVPASMRSGVYALHLVNDEGEDHVPFIVTPPRGTSTADILFLAPTFSYLAYGNEAMANRPDIAAMLDVVGIEGAPKYPFQQEDAYIVENRLLSCYDIHSDGSGVCYSSHRRPILSMRPSYLMPLLGMMVRPGGATHQLPCDLYITHWLEQKAFAYDVATDHDLHEQGAALLSRYKVIITGSHPEYYSREMWGAMEGYLNAGGRLMYCGGNGFLCVTSLSHDGKAIETRRMRTNRAWTSHPGEERHSTTGEVGGIWAMRGRASNRLVGVSTSCVGYTSGAPYARTEASYDPRVAFMFEGLDDGLIGAFPNLVYGEGPAGFEIDRAEVALGTPEDAVVVATARLVDDSYQQVLHELEAPGSHYGGVTNPACRADITYLEYPGGGATWTPGSILWAGALSYNGFDNNVSRMTENVLRRFLEPHRA